MSKPTYEELEATVTNLTAQVQGLAAENGSIKAMNDCLSEELRGYESDGAFEGPKMHLLWWKMETPNTDAALAEIRAQGVDGAIETIITHMNHQHVAVKEALHILKVYAEQLRKEQGK